MPIQLLNPNDTLATGTPSGTVTIDPGNTITKDVPYYRYSSDPTKVYQNSLFAPPTAPDQTPLNLTSPAATTTPPLPPTTAADTHDTFFTSATATLDANRKAVEDAYKKSLEDIHTQQADTQKQMDQLTSKEQNIIEGPVKDVLQPFQAQMEKFGRAKYNVDQNFQENQKLVNELDSLLTEGNTMIAKLKSEKVPGLAGLQQSPRITNALNNVAARAGVIQAVMAARNNQISVAEGLIDRSVAATTADKKDQLNYYQTLLNFFDKQRDEAGNKLINLDKQEQGFLGAQIGLLENDLKTSQATADYIKKLMVDPQTAQLVANSGVTLNDSPETINSKFATYINNQEIQATQKANREAAANQNITTQFYEKADGTVGLTQSGLDFTSPEDFQKKTGMTIQQAAAKGMISKLTSPVDLKQYPTSYQEYYLAKQQGYDKSYNEWLTEDANRKATHITYNQGQQISEDQDAIDAAALLNARVGTNFHVSPEDYKKAKDTWVGLGHSAETFDTRFSNYVDPTQPADYGVKWKTAPPSAFDLWLQQNTPQYQANK